MSAEAKVSALKGIRERSSSMLGLGLQFLKQLGGREKATLLLYLTLPSASRISALGAFAVSLRAIVTVARGNADGFEVIGWGAAIVFCLGVATFITWAQRRVLISNREIFIRSIRRITARWMGRLRGFPKEERDEYLEAFIEYDKRGFAQCLNSLLALMELVAGVLLVFALVAGLVILSPVLGLMILLVGAITFLMLSGRILSKRKPQMESLAKEELEELEELRNSLVSGDGELEPLQSEFEHNSYDKVLSENFSARKREDAKDSAAISVAALLALLGAFVLIWMGFLSLKDPIWILIFVLTLRLAIAQGKFCLEKWAAVLNGRSSLARMFQMVPDDRESVRGLGQRLVRLSKS